MTDHHPPNPDPDRSGGSDQNGDDGRNQWDFEAPDPALSFHGDLPTDPDALADRPTGADVPPPAGVAAGGIAAGATSASMPPPTAPGAPDPDATRVVDAVPPPAAGTGAGTPVTRRVGMRTAAMMVGVAALVGLVIVGALAFTGGDDGEVVATGVTPGAEPTMAPTPEPTAGPTPEQATPTPGPTATPQPPPSAVRDLVATDTAFGAQVAERWELEAGRLTSTIEISNDTDATIAGLHVVIIPNSVTTDLMTVDIDPAPVDEVEADDPAAAIAVELEPGDPPVTITWSADVELATGETPDAALDRLLGDRAAAAFRFTSGGPDVTVNAPDDESTTIGSSVTMRGRTDPDATLTVAGVSVAVDADNGRFRTEIERTRDRRELTIIATDPYGRTTQLTWTVRFADPAPTPTPTPRPVAPPVVQPPQPQPQPQPQPRPPTPAPPPQCDPLDEGCR